MKDFKDILHFSTQNILKILHIISILFQKTKKTVSVQHGL